jgi:hypothetical protein
MLDYSAVRARRTGSPGTSCLVLQILLMVIIWVLVSIKFFKFYLWVCGHNFGSRFEQVSWQDQTSLPKKGISVQPTFFTRNNYTPSSNSAIPYHNTPAISSTVTVLPTTTGCRTGSLCVQTILICCVARD